MNKPEIDKIKRFLSEKRKIVIIPHKNPDGDAIGSSTALKYYLDNFNHIVDIISPNQFPEFLKWMDPYNVIKIFDEDEKYAQKIIDESTIIIFDEFLMNDHWENDERKALEEFCRETNMTFEVVAVSLFTKQVAVKVVKSLIRGDNSRASNNKESFYEN
mgnify:CR=1 FL=1